MRKLFSSLIITLLFMASCTSTTVLSTWKDDRYGGTIKRVLILGAAENPGIRRVFEREFSNQLKAQGITALPSNQMIPSERMLDKQVILSKIKELNIDAVLITKLVERRRESTYFPTMYDSYEKSYGRTYEDEFVNLQTDLYDARTEQLIWSALSETVIMEGEGVYNTIKVFIQDMVNNLTKEKLI